MQKSSRHQISQSRLRSLKKAEELVDFIKKLLKPKAIIKGTAYTLKKKCGNKNCKCARGNRHELEVVSFSNAGKTRLISLAKYTPQERENIQQLVDNYQHFRRTRAHIVSYFKTLIAEINTLEQTLLTQLPLTKGATDGNRQKSNRKNKRKTARTIQ